MAQLDQVQGELEAAEADRQVLVAQRDGWLASYQESYGLLQQLAAARKAADQRLAGRAAAMQAALAALAGRVQAETAAADRRAASGCAGGGGRRSSSPGDADGTCAEAASDAAAAAAAEALGQVAGLQQLVAAEAARRAELDGCLKVRGWLAVCKCMACCGCERTQGFWTLRKQRMHVLMLLPLPLPVLPLPATQPGAVGQGC